MAEEKKNTFVDNIRLLDNSMKQTLQGLVALSPVIGMFTGYGLAGWGGAAVTGIFAGPVVAVAALTAYTYLGLDIGKTARSAFNLHAKDVRNFVKPKSIVQNTTQGIKKSLGSLMTLLPAGTAATFAAMGATLMAPGVGLPWAATGVGILAPWALAAAAGLGAVGFAVGGIMASKLTDNIEKNRKENLFSPTGGRTTMEKAKIFLGRILSYHPQGKKKAIHYRHPASAAAIVGGAVAGAILAVSMSWATLPLALAGAFIGGAATLPIQEEAVRRGYVERPDEVGVSPDETAQRVGVSPQRKPSPLNDLSLSDKFQRRQGRKVGASPAPVPSPSPAAKAGLTDAELAEKFSRKHGRAKTGATPGQS